jgi:hypothetical protein
MQYMKEKLNRVGWKCLLQGLKKNGNVKRTDVSGKLIVHSRHLINVTCEGVRI